jgi:uncharacterized protein (TIGR02246 family)
MTSDLRIAILTGSTRPNGRSRAVAEWVAFAAHTDGLDLVIVDLDEVGLPMLAEPSPAAFGDYTLSHTREWAELIDGFDGYVLVSPEYNHSTTAPLKNALDHLYGEWHDKAVGFVGYGVDGGIRAVEHLRAVTAELGMAGVGPQVALYLFEDFDGQGGCSPRQRQSDALERMLGQLARWAGALRQLRDCLPRGTTVETDDVGARPRLHQSTRADEAGAAVKQLVERLQTGLDRGDADYYDAMFSADVVWGSPYGQVVFGYEPLNAAHRSLMKVPGEWPSLYESVQTCAITPDVVVTQVRRQSLPEGDSTTGSGFSEMALYVLVRRDGQWWLAAGQNTPIADRP